MWRGIESYESVILPIGSTHQLLFTISGMIHSCIKVCMCNTNIDVYHGSIQLQIIVSYCCIMHLAAVILLIYLQLDNKGLFYLIWCRNYTEPLALPDCLMVSVLTQFPVHLLTSPHFIHKLALEHIYVWIQLWAGKKDNHYWYKAKTQKY